MYRTLLLCGWLLFATVAPAFATTYYVRTDGNNANTGTSNTAGGAWLTIDRAFDSPIAAGDIIRVQAGNYGAAVTPATSGTAGNPITIVADGTVNTCFWTFSGRSYIRVIGFTMGGTAASCSTGNGTIGVNITGSSDHLEFWNNTFQDIDQGVAFGSLSQAPADHNCDSCIVMGNVFQRMTDGGGGANAIPMFAASHTLIAYNEINDARPDAAFVFGTFNRWLNNYVHDLSNAEGGHIDMWQLSSNRVGSADNLFEGNFQVGIGSASDEHITNWSNNTSCTGGCGFFGRNVIRQNTFHNLGSTGLSINQTANGNITPVAFYNNTSATVGLGTGVAAAAHAAFGVNPPVLHLFNNIEYESWLEGRLTSVSAYYVETTPVIDYNLAYDPDGTLTFISPWTLQSNPRNNSNPNFVNYASLDFTLAAGSGDGANARGTGGPLTTTSDSGTGTTFSVAAGTGFYFFGDDTDIDLYGGHLVTGDVLTVGTDTCTVASISTDAITCVETFTWANGESVYLGTDTTPDIGAYPYRAAGYTLSATYSEAGGTATITPNDAALVRFVVCFEDSLPTTVDNSSPYTCSVGSGTKVYRVYPKYPSTTLWATASASGESPASGNKIRIRIRGGDGVIIFGIFVLCLFGAINRNRR